MEIEIQRGIERGYGNRDTDIKRDTEGASKRTEK